MFVSQSEYRCHNPLLEKRLPTTEGWSHMYAVLKLDLLPTFTVTGRALDNDAAPKLVGTASDAASLWCLHETFAGARILGVDCMIWQSAESAWCSRPVEQVWVEPGREMTDVYLKFRDEPDAFYDAYTFRIVEKKTGVDWVPLFTVSELSVHE